jgi:hypothetical protein
MEQLPAGASTEDLRLAYVRWILANADYWIETRRATLHTINQSLKNAGFFGGPDGGAGVTPVAMTGGTPARPGRGNNLPYPAKPGEPYLAAAPDDASLQVLLEQVVGEGQALVERFRAQQAGGRAVAPQDHAPTAA